MDVELCPDTGAHQGLELHRSAIALNNIGVLLLEQGAAKQALDTFRDAVDTLKIAYNPSAVTKEISWEDLLSNTLEKTRTASGKVSSVPPCIDGKTSVIETQCWDELDDLSRSQALSVASCGFGQQCAVVFSISHQVAVSTRDREIDSSLLLYNYAVGYLSMAKGKNTSQARRSALCLLRMSFTIFVTNLESGLKGRYWEEESATRVLGLAIGLLSNLSRTLFFEGYEREARDCYCRLGEICEALTTVEEIQLVSKRSISAAAA